MINFEQFFDKLDNVYDQFTKSGVLANNHKQFLLDCIDSGIWDSAKLKTTDFRYFQIFDVIESYLNNSLDKKKSIDHFIKMFALDIDIYELRDEFHSMVKSSESNEAIAIIKDKLQIQLLEYFEENPKDYKYTLRTHIDFKNALELIYNYMGLDVELDLPAYDEVNTINFPTKDFIEILLQYNKAITDPLKIEFNSKQIEFLDQLYKTFYYLDNSTNEFILPEISNINENVMGLFLLSNDNVKNPRTYEYFLNPFQLKVGKSFNKLHPFKSLQTKLKSKSQYTKRSGSFDEFSLILWILKTKHYPNKKTSREVKVFFLTFLNQLCNITETFNVFGIDYFSPEYYNLPDDKQHPENDPWDRWRESRKTSKTRIN